MDDDGKVVRNGFLLGLFIVLTQVFIVSAIISPSMLNDTISSEIDMMIEVFGEEPTDRIIKSTKATTHAWFYDSGLMDIVRSSLLPREYIDTGETTDDKTLNTSFWGAVDRSVVSFFDSLALSIFRLYSLTFWLPMFTLMMIGGVTTGLLLREIKKHGFEYSSPLRHGIARRLIYLSPLLAYIILMLPLAVHPHIYPFILATFAMAIALILANTIKRT